MSRTNAFLIVAASALLSAPAHAIGVAAAPLQTGGTVTEAKSGGGARARCSTCATTEQRQAREKLFQRLDSLRWEIENRRMTHDERTLAEREFVTTVRLLQRSLDEQREMEAAVIVRGDSLRRAQGGAGAGGFAITVQPRRSTPTRGYMGVTFEGLTEEYRTPTDHSVRFFKYPRVALVEPSSPAERAGVMLGDTLLALNGTDVVSEVISFTKLLVPEARITLRVRRDGSSKDLKVTVGEAPEYYVYRREQPMRTVVVPVPGQSAPMPAVPRSAAGGGAEAVGAYGTPSATTAPSPSQGSVRRMPDGQTPIAVWVDYEGLAGARMEALSEGWAKALKLERGVMVVRSRPGTPAYRSGLRDADVIVKAAGYDVNSVTNLRSVLAAGDGAEGVKLVIVREGKERDVTLRWER